MRGLFILLAALAAPLSAALSEASRRCRGVGAGLDRPRGSDRRSALLGGAAAAALPLVGVPAARAEGATPVFDMTVPFRGNEVPLSKFRGTAHLVVNIKMDDPVAGANFQALKALSRAYFEDGLRIWAFPTDQGYFEPNVAELVRSQAYQAYGFGQYPTAVVFDKVDVLGKTAHPLFTYLAQTPNPNGVGRLTLNFEKFLLDGDGRPLRRYPRQFLAYDFEKDVKAALQRDPLPEPTDKFREAWFQAKKEAKASEYAFRTNYNVYDQQEKSSDWEGLAESSFL